MEAVNELAWWAFMQREGIASTPVPTSTTPRPDFQLLPPADCFIEVTTLNVSDEDKAAFQSGNSIVYVVLCRRRLEYTVLTTKCRRGKYRLIRSVRLFQAMLQQLRVYFREMNVGEQLADATLRIEPEHMRVLSYAELYSYGLTTEDPVAREIKELEIAKKYGLSRQEYMSRKILAEQYCANDATICYQKIIQTGKIDPRVSPNELDFSQFGRAVK